MLQWLEGDSLPWEKKAKAPPEGAGEEQGDAAPAQAEKPGAGRAAFSPKLALGGMMQWLDSDKAPWELAAEAKAAEEAPAPAPAPVEPEAEAAPPTPDAPPAASGGDAWGGSMASMITPSEAPSDFRAEGDGWDGGGRAGGADGSAGEAAPGLEGTAAPAPEGADEAACEEGAGWGAGMVIDDGGAGQGGAEHQAAGEDEDGSGWGGSGWGGDGSERDPVADEGAGWGGDGMKVDAGPAQLEASAAPADGGVAPLTYKAGAEDGMDDRESEADDASVPDAQPAEGGDATYAEEVPPAHGGAAASAADAAHGGGVDMEAGGTEAGGSATPADAAAAHDPEPWDEAGAGWGGDGMEMEAGGGDPQAAEPAASRTPDPVANDAGAGWGMDDGDMVAASNTLQPADRTVALQEEGTRPAESGAAKEAAAPGALGMMGWVPAAASPKKSAISGVMAWLDGDSVPWEKADEVAERKLADALRELERDEEYDRRDLKAFSRAEGARLVHQWFIADGNLAVDEAWRRGVVALSWEVELLWWRGAEKLCKASVDYMQRLRAAEDMAPVRIAQRMDAVRAQEPRSRAGVVDAEAVARADLSFAARDQARAVDARLAARAAAVAALEGDEAAARKAVAAGEPHAYLYIAAQECMDSDFSQARAERVGFAASEATERCVASEAAHRREAVAMYASMFDAICAQRDAHVEGIHAAARARLQAVEAQLGSVVNAEARQRADVEAEEAAQVVDVAALGKLLRSAFETEVEAARVQEEKERMHAVNALKAEERDARRDVEAAEEAGHLVLVDREYAAFSDVVMEERQRQAAQAQAMQRFANAEAHARLEVEGELARAADALFEAQAAFFRLHGEWQEAMHTGQQAVCSDECQARDAVAAAAEHGLALLHCCFDEPLARAQLAADLLGRAFHRTCGELEQIQRSSLLIQEKAACAALRARAAELAASVLQDQIAVLAAAEGAGRVRIENEELIFSGSLAYHRERELEGTLEAQDRRDMVVVDFGDAERAGSQRDSPLAVQRESTATQFLQKTVEDAEAEEFRFQALLEDEAARAHFRVGEHATVEAALETLSFACKASSFGWKEEKGRYAGQTGYVCDRTPDSALLFFSDDRQYWFPQAALRAPSDGAARAAPQAPPEAAAKVISRSLLRVYLNTVLPGGDHADTQTILAYVLVPLLLLLSIPLMSYYKWHSV